MKKVLLVAVYLMTVVGVVYAGTQYNWGTSSGANWITPDNTAILPNQALVIGSTTTYPTVITSTTAAVGIGGQTLAQILLLSPGAAGQLLLCSNCTNTPLVISTGTGQGAWVGVFQSTTNSGLIVAK